jgi:hypothetical protein
MMAQAHRRLECSSDAVYTTVDAAPRHGSTQGVIESVRVSVTIPVRGTGTTGRASVHGG